MLGFKSSCWLHRNRGRRWDYYKRAKRKNKGKNMHVSLCQVYIIESKSSFFLIRIPTPEIYYRTGLTMRTRGISVCIIWGICLR